MEHQTAFILALLCRVLSARLCFQREMIVPSSIKFMDGVNNDFIYIDENDRMHRMQLNGENVSQLYQSAISFGVEEFSFKRTYEQLDYYLVEGRNQVMIIRVEGESHSSFKLSTNKIRVAGAVGTTPKYMYLAYSNSTHYRTLIQRLSEPKHIHMEISKTKTLRSMFIIHGNYLYGYDDGSIYSTQQSIYLNFTHNGPVIKIHHNETTANLITADATGQIIVAYGQPSEGFSFNFSYQHHQCQIVSLVVHQHQIISSDSCGIVVEFDMVEQTLVDIVSHPDHHGSMKVMISHYMDGFFLSAVENGSSIYLVNTLSCAQTNTTNSSQVREQSPVVKALGSIASVPALKVTMKSTFSLFVLMEDFYFYSYHLYTYNEGIREWLITMHEITSQKINPTLGFMADQKIISKHLSFQTEVFQGIYPIRDLANDGYFHLHFLQYTKNIYIETFMAQILTFFLIKVIFLILMRAFRNCPKVILILSMFQGNTLFWMLAMIMIGDNLPYFSFATGAQLRVPFYLTPAHKLNVAICIMVFFVCLQYSLCYFPLIYQYQNKRNASNGLYLCECSLKGFILQGCIFGVRNLAGGFIHGFFLDNHQLQIILLIGLNGLILVLIGLLRRQFRYKVTFLFTFLYYFGYVVFNVLILMEIHQLPVDFDMACYSVLFALFVVSITRVAVDLFILVLEVRYLYLEVCKFMEMLEKQQESKGDQKDKKVKKVRKSKKIRKKKKSKTKKNQKQNEKKRILPESKRNQIFPEELLSPDPLKEEDKNMRIKKNQRELFNLRITEVEEEEEDDVQRIQL